MILTRLTEQRRSRLSELELQTRYLVGAIWAASGNSGKGQAQKAVEQVRFLPRERRRRIPTVGQVMRMFGSGSG